MTRTIHVEGPFGGCDEQAEHNALWDMMGRNRTERLARLWSNSYPCKGPGVFDRYGKEDVWRRKAEREGYTDCEIAAFAHVAGIGGAA